jgi:hypothetical protein
MGASASRSFTSFPPGVRPPPPSPWASLKVAIGAVDTMEEAMPWTITELMQLTRDEFCNLAALIEHSLLRFEAGTAERHDVLTSLRNIRRVMMQRGLHY